MRRRWMPCLAIVVMIALLPNRAAGARTITPATPAAVSGDFAGLVDIGGRRLYLECRGAGSPTVILEAGFRTRADVWSDDLLQPDSPRMMVLPGVARFTRVCAYDRPGTATVTDGVLHPSRSDPAPMPRTARDAVADLHALLQAARLPGPYVLVGHSYGGLFVRLYASTYPDDVVGLVLVDAFPETLADAMTPAQWRAYKDLFQPVPPALADYAALEFTDLDASDAQMAEATATSPLRTMPVVVLSRGQAMAMPADLPCGLTGAMLERAWQRGQDLLAGLVPGTRHVIAKKSEHYIQLQQPELVIAAVRVVVDAVRDPSSWTSATTGASPDSAQGVAWDSMMSITSSISQRPSCCL